MQTNNLAVGASVPYAAAGVGAIASQFETNPMYGPRGVALLTSGKNPEQTIKQLLQEDGGFDGQGIEARQVGVVSINGLSFAYTGADAAASVWAGSKTGKSYSIQGNGLAGPQVVEAMEKAFLSSEGTLPERLIAALSAGDRAGGQSTGKESAALLVRTVQGFPLDTDLRVDHSADPVADLRVLLNIQMARQQIVQARNAARKGQFQEAEGLLVNGVARAPMWSRIWIQGARVATLIERPELALQYLNIVFTLNAAWAESELGSGRYPELGANPLFHRWITNTQEQAALSKYRQIQGSPTPPADLAVDAADALLEVGRASEALEILNGVPPADAARNDVVLSKATAHAALGDIQKARALCRNPLPGDPSEAFRRRCSSWEANPKTP